MSRRRKVGDVLYVGRMLFGVFWNPEDATSEELDEIEKVLSEYDGYQIEDEEGA
jgi:hypothetical protein